MSAPKIGVLDLELAPIDAHVWRLFDQNVGLNQIVSEWAIISFAFKPLGLSRRHVEYMDTSAKADPRDDYELCARLWEIMHEYDFLVAQNGQKFDKKKVNARLIMHGFPPPSPTRVLDTMLMARQVASFTSNKLEWLATYLSKIPKQKHREFPGHELWMECMNGNPRAWRAMRAYNIPDILACEQVYMRLRPWVSGHPNIVVFDDDDTPACPVCGSTKLKQDGHSHTNVGKYLRFQCQSPKCGAWSRSRYTLNTLTKRKGLLTNG